MDELLEPPTEETAADYPLPDSVRFDQWMRRRPTWLRRTLIVISPAMVIAAASVYTWIDQTL